MVVELGHGFNLKRRKKWRNKNGEECVEGDDDCEEVEEEEEEAEGDEGDFDSDGNDKDGSGRYKGYNPYDSKRKRKELKLDPGQQAVMCMLQPISYLCIGKGLRKCCSNEAISDD